MLSYLPFGLSYSYIDDNTGKSVIKKYSNLENAIVDDVSDELLFLSYFLFWCLFVRIKFRGQFVFKGCEKSSKHCGFFIFHFR